MMLPLNISRSAESIPIGATKNRLNRNFRRNMIIIMATMIDHVDYWTRDHFVSSPRVE